MANHLSRFESHAQVNDDSSCIQEEFSNEQLMELDIAEIRWYADIVNLLVSGIYPVDATSQYKKKLFSHGGERTTQKVLQSRFFWPTLFRDDIAYVREYGQFHRMGTISRRHEIPLNNILQMEIFVVWRVDFMGSFPPLNGNIYILVDVDYVSK